MYSVTPNTDLMLKEVVKEALKLPPLVLGNLENTVV